MLTERQLEIVLSVVYEYITTGEPVGSRTISKKYVKGCSAATVRNEMSDLEEMGYFYQPHTSAGRLPTPSAYRVYVNSILHRSRSAPPGLESWVRSVKRQKSGVEMVLSQVSRLLGQVTSYLGVAAVTSVDDLALCKIDLIRMGERSVLLLVVLEGGIVRSRQILLNHDIDQEALDELSSSVNQVASGNPWNKVRDVLAQYVSGRLEEYWDLCRATIDRLDSMLSRETYHMSTGGMSQMFNVPDFADLGRIQTLLALVEEESTLVGMIKDCSADQGVKVTIGTENLIPSMKDCSVVMASSSVGARRSIVGLIGPVRMNYEHSIAVLEAVLDGLNDDDSYDDIEEV
nr:heat-inducible transcriptional repressor HrcA [uncultured Dethiosulfovibrio sp.]